jgi:hypothetical protein
MQTASIVVKRTLKANTDNAVASTPPSTLLTTDRGVLFIPLPKTPPTKAPAIMKRIITTALEAKGSISAGMGEK